MKRELAEQVAKISMEELELANKKWIIQKQSNGVSWEELKTEAIQFLLENK